MPDTRQYGELEQQVAFNFADAIQIGHPRTAARGVRSGEFLQQSCATRPSQARCSTDCGFLFLPSIDFL